MTTMQDSPSFQERLDSLRAESQGFADYLRALPPESWNAQSACDLWQVGHVVAHLVGVAEFYATTVERGREGNFETLPGRAPAGSQTGATSHEGIHQRALAAREQLGDQVVSQLAAESDRLINVLANLKPEDHPKPCYHPGDTCLPATSWTCGSRNWASMTGTSSPDWSRTTTCCQPVCPR